MVIELPNRFFSYYSVRFPRGIKWLSENVKKSSLKSREIGKIVYIWEIIITGFMLGAPKESIIGNIHSIINRINLIFYDFFDDSNMKSDIDFIYTCIGNTYLEKNHPKYNMKNLMDRLSREGNSIYFKSFVEL